MAKPLTTQRLPYNADLSERFPSLRLVAGGEGFSVFEAEEGEEGEEGEHYCLVVDAGTMADFADDDDPALQTMITVHSFASEEERTEYLQEQGWPRLGAGPRVPVRSRHDHIRSLIYRDE